MSALIHRCAVCGHANYQHRVDSAECQYGWCRKGKHVPEYGPPELVATYDRTGAELDVFTRPGGSLNPGNPQSEIKLCDCDEWQAAAADLVGVS